MKKVLKSLRLIALILFLLMLVLSDAFLLEPNMLRVRYENFSSAKIPAELNDYTILFFSDLHYNRFTTKERVKKIVDTINGIGADTVVFLGDLYDHPTIYEVDNETAGQLAELLAAIKAPYGKFAVLGNHDYDSPETAQIVTKTLQQANFEVLINDNLKLYHSGEAYLRLISVDCLALGNPDLTRALKGSSDQTFNLLITHAPDIYDDVDPGLVSLMLAGHSHGGQIKLPLFQNYLRTFGAQKYFSGKYSDSGLLLDITNGVGNTYINARFNAPAELVVYHLYSLE